MVEDWVLLEAARQSDITTTNLGALRGYYGGLHPITAYKALCDALIAPPLEKPVDRKLLCAREACASIRKSSIFSDDYRKGYKDESPAVLSILMAFELYEQGFGK